MEKDTILYVLTKSQEYLGKRQIPNPRLDAELILSDVLNMERIKLYSNFDKKLTEPEKDNYREKIKARGEFKPVAYIIGKKNFYKSSFLVNEKVLIPRPETEELLEWVSKEIKGEDSLFVLDLCAGSGCIGISLKKDFPKIALTMTDISQDALDVAGANVNSILSNAEVSFLKSDLFDSFDENLKFNFILSNPPYIPIQEKETIMPDVLNFEPHLALFLEEPQVFYQKLLKGAYKHLSQPGFLYLETHTDWANKISEMSKEFGFTLSQVKKDLSNKDRFVKLTK